MRKLIAMILVLMIFTQSIEPIVAKADPVTESLWAAINKAISDIFYICTKDDSDPQTGGQMLWENIKEADARNREYMINCLYCFAKYQAYWFTPESADFIKEFVQEQGTAAYPAWVNLSVIADSGRHYIDYGNGQQIPSTIINGKEFFLSPYVVNKWIENGKMELINKVSQILDRLNIHSLGEMNKAIQDTSTEENSKNAELVTKLLKMLGAEVDNVTRGLVYIDTDFDDETLSIINSDVTISYMRDIVKPYFDEYKYYVVFYSGTTINYLFCNEPITKYNDGVYFSAKGLQVLTYTDRWGDRHVSNYDVPQGATSFYSGNIAFANTPGLPDLLTMYQLQWNGTLYPYIQTKEPAKTYTGIANVEKGQGMSLPSNDKPVENYTNDEIHEAIGDNDTAATYGDTDATREEVLQKTAEEIITQQGEYSRGVLGWLQRLWDAITNIPKTIWNFFKTILDLIYQAIIGIWTAVKGIFEFITNFFVIDWSEVKMATSNLKTTWNSKFGVVINVAEKFKDLQVNNMNEDPPIITMKTPKILKPYMQTEEMEIMNLTNMKDTFKWVRGIISAMIWFGLGINIFNHFNPKININ